MTVNYTELKNGGFLRQKQKGYFSLRLRVVGGDLSAGQLAAIAQAAEKYGDGYVHLTSRQSVEIPFVNIKDVENIKSDLAASGVEPGVCGPGVRTVTACQGSRICQSGCAETLPLAKELDARYFGKKLPHKFKVGVTGCQNNCLKAEENDMGFKGAMKVKWVPEKCIFCGACTKACRADAITIEEGQLLVDYEKCKDCGRCAKSCPTEAWDTESGYILSFGGLFGNSISKGKSLLPVITDHDTLIRVADAAIDFFIQYGESSERFKYTLDRVGWDVFETQLKEALQPG